MADAEIIFAIEEVLGHSYAARTLDYSIFTESDTFDELGLVGSSALKRLESC